jgi:hypothetical protein
VVLSAALLLAFLQGSILTDALDYVMQAIGLKPLKDYLNNLFNVRAADMIYRLCVYRMEVPNMFIVMCSACAAVAAPPLTLAGSLC